MKPVGESASMARVDGFIQREPRDGAQPSQRTEVYLGYDHKNLYIVFLCFDSQHQVRSHLTRREDIFDDDTVEVMIDTFHDQRRAYVFQANPLGVQWDGTWKENTTGSTSIENDSGNFDSSFDTVWNSRGRVTPQGFIISIAIPFKSLRFSSDPQQTWGIILNRTIPRTNENLFWPPMTKRLQGRLNQAADLTGLEGISPSRNMQFIPYGIMRSYRDLDSRDPNNLRFDQKDVQGQMGLDSKFILKDSLVLDLTANPDFSQVESDEPQVTINQRFEVFFPEKRPFFLENADYFQTPLDLVFTRRIVDPDAGARLTGRVGKNSMGMFVADDRSPGLIVPNFDTNYGNRAYFAIGRFSRDILHQSSVGAIYTDREFNGAFNRVGGFDSRLKFSKSLLATMQAVESATRNPDGTYQSGPAYSAELQRSGLRFNSDVQYQDIAAGFVSEPGFIPRIDIRDFKENLSFRFYPKNNILLSWGPGFAFERIWDHNGVFLDGLVQPRILMTFPGNSLVVFQPSLYPEQLRPSDFSTLPKVTSFDQRLNILSWTSSYFSQFLFNGTFSWGTGVNYLPPADKPPVLDNNTQATFEVILHPLGNLKIDNLYLWNRLVDRPTGMAVLNNHILRSTINYQLTRALSLRFIPQYTSALVNPALTSLKTTKQFNADFLITYLVHPSTAIYVGYNSDLQNLVNPLGLDPNGQLLRTRGKYLNDGRTLFVKISYLFRF